MVSERDHDRGTASVSGRTFAQHVISSLQVQVQHHDWTGIKRNKRSENHANGVLVIIAGRAFHLRRGSSLQHDADDVEAHVTSTHIFDSRDKEVQ